MFEAGAALLRFLFQISSSQGRFPCSVTAWDLMRSDRMQDNSAHNRIKVIRL